MKKKSYVFFINSRYKSLILSPLPDFQSSAVIFSRSLVFQSFAGFITQGSDLQSFASFSTQRLDFQSFASSSVVDEFFFNAIGRWRVFQRKILIFSPLPFSQHFITAVIFRLIFSPLPFHSIFITAVIFRLIFSPSPVYQHKSLFFGPSPASYYGVWRIFSFYRMTSLRFFSFNVGKIFFLVNKLCIAY